MKLFDWMAKFLSRYKEALLASVLGSALLIAIGVPYIVVIIVIAINWNWCLIFPPVGWSKKIN